MAICAFCMFLEIFFSGTMMRFSSYGLAISLPSASRMRDCWASGETVNSLGRSLKKLTPPLAAWPGGADRRDGEPGHQQPGHRAQHDEAEQEPEHG